MTIIEELEQRLEVMEKVAKAYGIFKEEVEQLQKALAELKESKREGKWKPKKEEYYWFRGTDCDYLGRQNKGAYDEWRINHLPIFKTDQECRKYWHFMDTVKEKSYEFSKEEWEDGEIGKWRIIYDGEAKGFCAERNYLICVFNATYFKSREDAQYIIDNFKEELMEYFL